MTTDLGRVHQRTQRRYQAGLARGASVQRATHDRWGRELGLVSKANGRPYEPCPVCERRAMTRERVGNDTIWRCESCGYADSDLHGPLV